jgi:hypothetical protein
LAAVGSVIERAEQWVAEALSSQQSGIGSGRLSSSWHAGSAAVGSKCSAEVGSAAQHRAGCAAGALAVEGWDSNSGGVAGGQQRWPVAVSIQGGGVGCK